LIVYVDSSFLISVYLDDTHSPAAEKLLRTEPSILTTPLHYAEWAHAIAQQIFRGRISATEAARAEQELEKDRQAGLWKDVAMPERVFEVCADLARQHGPKLGNRTLDSLHVACALELNAERFWTFDERQAKLAKARGLKVG
jgi:predicted nucleic acid-binding protein